MKNATYLYIHQPCHEDWDKMTPENKGRFCASCAKSVVDFSLMTDNEVLAHLSKNTGNLCGRFDAEQLQRPLLETQLQPKKNWKYWLASLSALFLFGNRLTAQAVNNHKIDSSSVKVPEVNNTLIVGRVIDSIRHPSLEGIVTDTAGNPLVGATIKIKELQLSTTTHNLGNFTLFRNIPIDTFTLVVSYVGYSTQQIIIHKSDNKALKIILKPRESQLTGEVIVVGGYSTSKSRRKVSKIDTLSTSINKIFKNEAFTIYPNPVDKNNSLKMSITNAGEYEVQFLDKQSKIVSIQKYTTLSPKEIIDITVPPNAASGLYYIRLVNTATQKQWVDKLVVL